MNAKIPFARIVLSAYSVLLLASCGSSLEEVTIDFQLSAENQTVNCNSSINTKFGDWTLGQLQFFTSNFELKDKAGKWHKATFAKRKTNGSEADNLETNSAAVALIGNVCPDAGNWQVNLVTKLNKNEIHGIQFSLGVPFELNHKNPMTQPSPLNQPDMFWTWQTGHKFLRFEMHSAEKEFVYHLGSTGCTSASPVRSPKNECKNPNRVTVTLNDFRASKLISLDLKSLLLGSNLDEEISCQSSPDNPQCESLFSRSGIGAEQKLFRVFE